MDSLMGVVQTTTALSLLLYDQAQYMHSPFHAAWEREVEADFDLKTMRLICGRVCADERLGSLSNVVVNELGGGKFAIRGNTRQSKISMEVNNHLFQRLLTALLNAARMAGAFKKPFSWVYRVEVPTRTTCFLVAETCFRLIEKFDAVETSPPTFSVDGKWCTLMFTSQARDGLMGPGSFPKSAN